jgi:hypothetical protein
MPHQANADHSKLFHRGIPVRAREQRIDATILTAGDTRDL